MQGFTKSNSPYVVLLSTDSSKINCYNSYINIQQNLLFSNIIYKLQMSDD